jgi:hypothetical protein
MKDMKKAIIIFALAVFSGTALFAQNVWTVNYDIGLPLGSMADYISKPSFRGFSINGNTYVTDNLSVGGTMHWNAYYEKYPRDTYELPDGAVTSTVWAKMYIMRDLEPGLTISSRRPKSEYMTRIVITGVSG